MWRRILSVIKKIARGESVTAIVLPAADWDRQYEKGNWDFLLDSQQNVVLIGHLLREMAAARGGLRVLDVGCGNGALARELVGSLVTYVGTDISSAAIASASTQYKDFTFVVQPMEMTPNLGTFDVIVFCEVLLYGPYRDILTTYQSSLVADGHVLISLYDSWRTRVIWRRVSGLLTTRKHFRVSDCLRPVTWNIKLCRYQ